MKNIYILLLLLLSSTSFLHAQEYIPITNIGGLENIEDNKNYILENDITIEGEGASEWKLKNINNVILDGNGKTITYKCSNNFALFDNIINSSINNLSLIYENSPNSETSFIMGGIANISSNSTISHCIVKKGFNIYPFTTPFPIPGVDIIMFTGGGIVANCDNNSLIQNCIFIGKDIFYNYNSSNPYSAPSFGGIAGSINNNSSVKNCLAINYILSSDKIKNDAISPDKNAENSASINNISDSEINNYFLKQNYQIEAISREPIQADWTNKTIILVNDIQDSCKLEAEYPTNIYFTDNKINHLVLGKNIIQSGKVIATNLILKDGCTLGKHGVDYTNHVYYYRNPSVWTASVNGNPNGKGWETLSLPFDAQLITVEYSINGIRYEKDLYPVGSGKPGSYWLRAFTGVDPENNANVIFQSTSNILKDQAYILSFPGSTFGEDSMEGKNLWFKSKTKEGNIKNHTANISFGNYTFKNHDLTKTTEDLTKGYFLDSPAEDGWDNGDGCMFLKYESNANVTPPRSGFRAWLNPISASATPGSLRIVSKPTTPTSLEDNMQVEAIRIYSQDGNLIIESDSVRTIDIFNALNGLKYKTVNLQNGSNTISGLQKGIYIIEGKKVVL